MAKGQFVVVEEGELEALERHDDSRTIDIERFVPLGDVDPDVDGPDVLPGAGQRSGAAPALQAPAGGDGGGRRWCDRTVRPLRRESLCLVRTRGQGLVLETMYLVEDVYSQAEIEEAMAETDVKPAELVSRAADRPGPRVRPRGAGRAPTAATSARCSTRSCAARRSPHPSRLPSRRPRSTSSRRWKASVAAAKASTSRPKKAADKPKAEKRPARKAARK